MAFASLWPLCAVLSLTVAQGKQMAHLLPVPEIMGVNPDREDGTWKMNIEWRDNFISSNKPEKVSYDVEIFYTEQMRRVHNETVEGKPNLNGTYHWSWTSPLPLQCTSRSVRLRFREHESHTSDWTPLYTLKGKDTEQSFKTQVYPEDYIFRVGGGTYFCCILKSGTAMNSSSFHFKDRISNRTFASDKIVENEISPANGFDVTCDLRDQSGATYFTGYAPDDHNLICETRDLNSVECHWSRGNIGETAMVKNVTYTVNGRKCSFESCVLDDSVDAGVRNWTLIAKNVLGVKMISDAADPKHRVRLKAPVQPTAVLVHARNATLAWEWNGMLKYTQFPMVCQVEINNHITGGTFSGTGLKSVVLADLQPFKNYECHVQCGSRNHFYKWGDWSKPIYFSTKEDIPEAIDVWIQAFNNYTYVVWKNLTASQSHGIITGYELLLGSSLNENKERIHKATSETCHKFRRADRNQIFSISAKNSAGFSHPSNITIPNLLSERDAITSTKTEHDGGFSVSWKPSSTSSCGYVVDWFPTHKTEECAVKWKKIPSGATNVTIYSDFKDGVKYTLSVYACTSGAPHLLQRSEIYVKERPPSGKVRNFKVSQHGSFAELSWEDMLEEEKNGLIKGFNVSYKISNENNNIEYSIIDSSHRLYRFNLRPGSSSYTFKVKAFTSAGEGPGSTITLSVTEQMYQWISSIFITLATIVGVILISFFCCSKRKWFKSKLYPDIPEPVLSEELFTKGFHQCHVIDKMLLTESEVLMVKIPEPCPEVVPQVQNEHEEFDLLSKDPPWPRYCNDFYDSQIASPITVDPFYTAVKGSGIQNPTYTMQLPFPVKTTVVLGYVPQTQTHNNLDQF